MTPRTHVCFLIAFVASTAACNTKNQPNYCPGNPHDNCLNDAGDATSCTGNQDCSGATAICDVAGSMTCVQCTDDQASACSALTPVCGNDHACRGCTAHAECDSLACLPDGSCAAEADIAYIDPGGTDNTICTQALPCTEVAKALATSKAFLKFHGTTDEAVTINDRNVTILSDPAAKLTRTAPGVILKIDGTSNVTIYDLEVGDGLGSGGIGISMPAGNMATLSLRRVNLLNNAGGGISASGGSLAVSQSTLSYNAGGGISVSSNATFVIVGNVVFSNGSGTGSTGGISILTAQSTVNKLEFNTVVRNLVQDSLGAGIQCTAGTFTAKNNIVWNNGTGTNLLQLGGSCLHTYSDVGPMPALGSTNIAMDPLFTNEATGNVHLGATSPARRAADPAADVGGPAAKDIDGEMRSLPADMGADQTL
jgi:hypothetical protein